MPKAEFARRDYYDTWLPELAPSAELMSFALAAETDAEWATFARRYRKEMSTPSARHLLDVLAELSHSIVALGRVLLRGRGQVPPLGARELLEELGADVT